MSIDFVVNCYERTYRDLMTPGAIRGLVEDQRHPFESVTLLVNNVHDEDDARARAAALVSSGEVSRFVMVRDELPAALRKTGLRARHLRRLPHFTDCCLVAVTLDGPDWLLYWDADARLAEPHDWLTPTLAYMTEHPELAVGNPDNWMHGLAEQEALSIDGDFALGYGFSDVAFLARRMDLARPIYRKTAPASWRYPLASVEPIFEQRVDAWMRRSGRLRATYLPVHLTHPDVVGTNYPSRSLRTKVRGRAQSIVLRLVSHREHPALRPWP